MGGLDDEPGTGEGCIVVAMFAARGMACGVLFRDAMVLEVIYGVRRGVSLRVCRGRGGSVRSYDDDGDDDQYGSVKEIKLSFLCLFSRTSRTCNRPCRMRPAGSCES